jgi:hypothetical protein
MAAEEAVTAEAVTGEAEAVIHALPNLPLNTLTVKAKAKA